MDSDDLGIWLREHPVGEFKPCSFYNADSDQLEVFWDNASYYGKSVKGMCVMRDQDGDSPVGVTVYSLKKVLREAGFELVPIQEESDQ